jgi:Glycosyltransferase family 87
VTTRSASWSPPADIRLWAGATLAGAVLLTAAWGLLHVGPFDDSEIVDTPVYQRYGDAMLDGQVPYRDFELEYPPAALPVFLVPSLAEEDDYRDVFEGLMLACGLAALAALAYALVVAGASARQIYGAVGLAAVAPLALGPVVLTRFDLWPAALLAGALAALAADRSRLGLGLLAVAAAAKLYALVVLPLALVYVGRRHGRRAALVSLGVFAAVAAAIVVPFAVVAPDGLAESVSRQAGRPLQIESLGAALLLVGHRLNLYEPTVVSSFGSQNLAGTLPDALGSMLTGLQVVTVVAVWILFARGAATPARLFVASAAAVTAFVAFGKVLSPQFLIWLVPLVPLVLAPLAAAVLVAALVLTQLWFPSRYWDYVGLGPEAWLVLGRDLVLVALVVLLVRELSRPGRAEPHTP